MPEIEFPPGTPEEMQEYLHRQINRQVMTADMKRHELTRFLSEDLNLEQTRMLRELLLLVDGRQDLVDYFSGVVSATLHFRFGLCLACGVNHDDKLAEVTNPPQVVFAVLDQNTCPNIPHTTGMVLDHNYNKVCPVCGYMPETA